MTDIEITQADADFAKAIEEQCSHGEYETAHCTADDLLTQLLLVLGCEKTVAAWQKVGKWYA